MAITPAHRFLPKSVRRQIDPQFRREDDKAKLDELQRLSPVASKLLACNDLRLLSQPMKVGPKSGFVREITFRSGHQLKSWLKVYGRSHIHVLKSQSKAVHQIEINDLTLPL
ncbi:hypothetical protein [uncultured Umboniibacter sp.]|uniref:hypothetical protein n=1 Tax=uncultured Umboniibacter sp. TaxID=1798917 RepID=UPI00260D13A3|nr:hypothetical protein [uncultured Umboniibacter sp.]